jgi:hypothetical protein
MGDAARLVDEHTKQAAAALAPQLDVHHLQTLGGGNPFGNFPDARERNLAHSFLQPPANKKVG